MCDGFNNTNGQIVNIVCNDNAITNDLMGKIVCDVRTNGNVFPGLTVWDVHTNGSVLLGLTVWDVEGVLDSGVLGCPVYSIWAGLMGREDKSRRTSPVFGKDSCVRVRQVWCPDV